MADDRGKEEGIFNAYMTVKCIECGMFGKSYFEALFSIPNLTTVPSEITQ